MIPALWEIGKLEYLHLKSQTSALNVEDSSNGRVVLWWVLGIPVGLLCVLSALGSKAASHAAVSTDVNKSDVWQSAKLVRDDAGDLSVVCNEELGKCLVVGPGIWDGSDEVVVLLKKTL